MVSSSERPIHACQRHFHHNHTPFNSGAKSLYACRHIGGALDAATGEIYLPGVKRAHNRRTGNNAIRQWTTLVRTMVVDRQETITQIENRNLSVVDLHGSPLSKRDVFATGNPYPSLHVSIISVLSISLRG